jgi:hypothetical protein
MPRVRVPMHGENTPSCIVMLTLSLADPEDKEVCRSLFWEQRIMEGTRLVMMLQAIAPAAILGEHVIGPRHRVAVRQRATTQAV